MFGADGGLLLVVLLKALFGAVGRRESSLMRLISSGVMAFILLYNKFDQRKVEVISSFHFWN